MKVLVTGGSGLVGRYVVDDLAQTASVEVLDIRPPHREDVPWHKTDILDLEGVIRIVHGFDAVVHLAGIPHPLNEPGETVFTVNTVGTFNMLEACVRNTVPRFVFLSSESTLGFAFSTTRLIPEYLPIDEDHPLRPQDPYGLSKLACEMLCRGYSDRSGMTTVCLRPPWIWVPDEGELPLYRQLIDEYPRWYKNLWAYIHVQDVCQAIRCALETRIPANHVAMFISAAGNWTGRESRELVRELYPEVKSLAPEFSGSASLISSARARRLLGFEPRCTVSDVVPNTR